MSASYDERLKAAVVQVVGIHQAKYLLDANFHAVCQVAARLVVDKGFSPVVAFRVAQFDFGGAADD